MKLSDNSVIIADSLNGLGTERFTPYFAFICCYEGNAQLFFNGREYQIQPGDSAVIVVGRLVERVEASADIKVKVIYVASDMVALSTPTQTNYGMRGFLTLFHEPVMRLNEEEQVICRRDFETFERRFLFRGHRFYWESLICVLQCMYFDFYHFHLRLYGEEKMSLQTASVVSRFLKLLQEGVYREHRSLDYYADKLYVSSKYLSEVVRKATGVTANHWINMMTSLDIARQLRNSELSLSEITYMFHFSSPSYFSRYVQRYLGITPTEFRGGKRKVNV